MTDSGEEQLASLGEPEHIIRQRLRDDADTQKIAKSLGVDIEDYITKVLFYARRPELAPQVEVLDDESLAAMGGDVPTEGEVDAWLDQVQSGEIDLSGTVETAPQTSEFTTEATRSDQLQAAMGNTMERRAPTMKTDRAAPPKPASILQQQLMAQQRQARARAEARRPSVAKPDNRSESDDE